MSAAGRNRPHFTLSERTPDCTHITGTPLFPPGQRRCACSHRSGSASVWGEHSACLQSPQTKRLRRGECQAVGLQRKRKQRNGTTGGTLGHVTEILDSGKFSIPGSPGGGGRLASEGRGRCRAAVPWEAPLRSTAREPSQKPTDLSVGGGGSLPAPRKLRPGGNSQSPGAQQPSSPRWAPAWK